jgi:hypothetical protein
VYAMCPEALLQNLPGGNGGRGKTKNGKPHSKKVSPSQNSSQVFSEYQSCVAIYSQPIQYCNHAIFFSILHTDEKAQSLMQNSQQYDGCHDAHRRPCAIIQNFQRVQS